MNFHVLKKLLIVSVISGGQNWYHSVFSLLFKEEQLIFLFSLILQDCRGNFFQTRLLEHFTEWL